jgi:lipid II:glycine glycyltransferase (peptidoglycan interpeptide bridge formation enzyme)
VKEKAEEDKWNYVEIRTTAITLAGCNGYRVSKRFLLHRLDLQRTLDEIFYGFHKDCVQRKIKTASRTGLICEEGRSGSLFAKFYSLLVATRRRHGVPVQPKAWFHNLITFLGDRLTIRVASKDGQPVASIMTLQFKQTVIYKYGCSDSRFNNMGATQLLLWRAIQEAKQSTGTEFDMGRSDLDNPGLIAFKDRWGAVRMQLAYHRCPAGQHDSSANRWQDAISKYVWSHAPESVLIAAGRTLYKHVG